jgi:hypothetical protein
LYNYLLCVAYKIKPSETDFGVSILPVDQGTTFQLKVSHLRISRESSISHPLFNTFPEYLMESHEKSLNYLEIYRCARTHTYTLLFVASRHIEVQVSFSSLPPLATLSI